MKALMENWRRFLVEEREEEKRIIDMYEVPMVLTINKDADGTTAETMALFRAIDNVTTIVKNEISDDEHKHKFQATLKIVVRKDFNIDIDKFLKQVIIPDIVKIKNISINKVGRPKAVDPADESFK